MSWPFLTGKSIILFCWGWSSDSQNQSKMPLCAQLKTDGWLILTPKKCYSYKNSAIVGGLKLKRCTSRMGLFIKKRMREKKKALIHVELTIWPCWCCDSISRLGEAFSSGGGVSVLGEYSSESSASNKSLLTSKECPGKGWTFKQI